MNLYPAKPLNSTIEISNEANRTTLKWKNPRGSRSRYFIVIFLLAWLGGWAMGMLATGGAVLSGNYDPFLIFWLVGWTIGGFFAMRQLYLMARPGKPEKVAFDSLMLEYLQGTAPFGGIYLERMEREKEKNRFFSGVQPPKDRYTILKREIGAVRLERVGERQRLTIDHGAERIEIGAFLREPEREWLYEVLKQWKENP